MKKIWERIKAEFRHQPLGSTYYLLGILGGATVLLGGVLSFRPNDALRPYLLTGILVLAWGILLVLPLLALRLRSLKSSEVPPLNPHVRSMATTFDVRVTKTHRLYQRRDRLKCLESVPDFTYKFVPTGSVTVKARLLEPSSARLVGPLQHQDHLLYQIHFSGALERDQIVDICLEYEVDDPHATMRPFSSVVAANLVAFDSLVQRIAFPADKPSSVEYEVTDTRTGMPVPPTRGPLFPGADGAYTWRLSSVLMSNTYWVFWRW